MANIILWKQNITFGKNVQKKRFFLHERCFMMIPRNVQPIQGKDSYDKLNQIKRANIIQNMDKNISIAYGELFKGIGCLPEQVHIKLAQDTVPVIEAYRKIPFVI